MKPSFWMDQCLAALVGLVLVQGAERPSAAPLPAQDQEAVISVRRGMSAGSGAEWDITLPKGTPGRIQDQVWLVIDGQSEGIGGCDIPPLDFPGAGRKPLRVYAGISNDLDGQVKDIMKAQGLPVKSDMTVYHISYGVGTPAQCTLPKGLHFRHSANALLWENWRLPATSHHSIGDRITLMDAVALDSAALGPKAFDLRNVWGRVKPDLPTDLAHHIEIQVQFLRVGPDGKLITK